MLSILHVLVYVIITDSLVLAVINTSILMIKKPNLTEKITWHVYMSGGAGKGRI